MAGTALKKVADRTTVREMAVVLARSLFDDPSMIFLIPDDDARAKQLPRLFDVILRKSLPFGVCSAVADGAEILGVAAWHPPGAMRSRTQEWATTAGYAWALRGRTRRAETFGEALREAHPTQPHWYLSVLGTDPSAQGRGVGTKLLTDRLAECDRAGEPAYLETNKERNVRFYERFGFHVLQEIEIPEEGPRTWAMWRDPK
ncbi:MAG: GNAT family N-acetyltransferase [Streptosporangiales bacterium]|nr:GNAT family N-acetyltransferase [Streptosporangiales bacterium]